MARIKFELLEGQEADAGILDDSGVESVLIHGGSHDGHTAAVCTEKHNCGGYGTSIKCSCGASWQSAMYGCWQHGHQRGEEGDQELACCQFLDAWHEGYAIIG